MKNRYLSLCRALLPGAILALLSVPAGGAAVEPLPARLEGTWRITKILPTTNEGCWTKERAAPLVGSTLVYRANSMTWKEGEVPVQSITSRTMTDSAFRKENTGAKPATFAQLGITARSVIEVNMQHEDQEITGASTEVPGDSVLLAAPGRIVVTACGVYMEATKVVTKPRPRR